MRFFLILGKTTLGGSCTIPDLEFCRSWPMGGRDTIPTKEVWGNGFRTSN